MVCGVRLALFSFIAVQTLLLALGCVCCEEKKLSQGYWVVGNGMGRAGKCTREVVWPRNHGRGRGGFGGKRVEVQESSVEHNGGTIEQHPTTVEETHAYFESLYNNLVIEVEKVNMVNRKMCETNADLTTELASSAKQITTLNEEIANLNNQLSKEKSNVSLLQEEKKKLNSDYKTREDELLDKQIQYEKNIKELDNILVKTGQSIQTMHMLLPKLDSFCHTEKKMALGDLKGKNMDTQCASDTLDPLSRKLEDDVIRVSGIHNTAKTRRPQHKSNTKKDRVPSASKGSCIKNNKVEVEEHHRNLLLSKNQKHK
ncbi:hypothetical protein Tco_0475915 [Tanacetum coccineum]